MLNVLHAEADWGFPLSVKSVAADGTKTAVDLSSFDLLIEFGVSGALVGSASSLDGSIDKTDAANGNLAVLLPAVVRAPIAITRPGFVLADLFQLSGSGSAARKVWLGRLQAQLLPGLS